MFLPRLALQQATGLTTLKDSNQWNLFWPNPSLGLGVALIAKIGVRSQNAVAVAVTRGLF